LKTFRDLRVWQKSHDMVIEIYRITGSFPDEERYGLVSQIRRSASSVPTNIVEGFKRRSRKEFAHFLNIAESSLEETKYWLILSKDLSYIKDEEVGEVEALCDEIGKMLFGLQASLSKKGSNLILNP
jgi:four helix bundle protein